MTNSARPEQMSGPANSDALAHVEYNPVEYRASFTRIEGPPSAATVERIRNSFFRLDSQAERS